MCVLAIGTSAECGELRVWTTADGQYSTIAEFVELDGDVVVLEKRSGARVRVPLVRLSGDDRRHIRRIAKNSEPDVGIRQEDRALDKRDGDANNHRRDREQVDTASAVESEASAMSTAKDALIVYEMHLAGDALPFSERQKVLKRVPYWEKLAQEDLVRLGKRWVSREEAEEASEKIKSNIEQAFELLRLGNGQLAKAALDEASEIDPDAVDAEFLKGLVYGLVAGNDRAAATCFAECVDRSPSNAAAQNNLAVSLFYCRRFGPAIDAWLTAAALSPESEEIANNLGCLIALEGRGLRVSGRKMQIAAKVYHKLISEHGHDRPQRVSFRYVPPHAAGVKYFGDDRVAGEVDGDLITIGSGSGFVISRGMIVTNHHVIDGGSAVLVLDPDDPEKRLVGEVIASDEDLDVALIECPKLDAPALPISTRLPSRGADIMVLGYPMGLEFGANVKSTRGSMVAMPTQKSRGICLYDAITNPGNSGGPLCDSGGRVVGVVRQINRFIGGVYGGAIPMTAAMEFIDEHVPGLSTNTHPPMALSWTEVDARVAPSTVLILNRARTQVCEADQLRRGLLVD